MHWNAREKDWIVTKMGFAEREGKIEEQNSNGSNFHAKYLHNLHLKSHQLY